MYKLLLVDDEEEVRKGIIQKIEWDKYGFEIVGECENGAEALEVAEKTLPDVVITDIKMPFMDGIKLSENLKEKLPNTKIVILTGFDEFEYAKKAIGLNVIEYLLKPISAQELIEVLKKIKKHLDDEIEEKENIYVLKEHYRKSLPVLKEKFLTSLITTKLEKEEVEEKLKNYNINLNGNGFIVSLINIDFKSVNSKPNKIKDENLVFNISEEKELWKFAVLNITEEIINNNNSGLAFTHGDSIVCLFFLNEEDTESKMNQILNVLENIRMSIQRYLNFTVTIGVGTLCEDVSDLIHSYQNAVASIDYSIILGNNRIICIEDIESHSDTKIIFDDLKEHALSISIKLGKVEEITRTIDKLFEGILDSKASINDYQIYFLEIITTILKVAKSSNVDLSNIFGPKYNMFVEINRFNHIEQIKNWIIDVSTKTMKYINKGRQDSCTILVNKAKQFVNENYSNSDISINKVCKYLHISPAYFSSIFKKEVKMTFVNYLTQIRMDTAKELLKKTDLKFFEIAEKVGYSESNYFSYSFKKNFGISPTEYRNN